MPPPAPLKPRETHFKMVNSVYRFKKKKKRDKYSALIKNSCSHSEAETEESIVEKHSKVVDG